RVFDDAAGARPEFWTESVTVKALPGASIGAGGFRVIEVCTRLGLGATTWTVWVMSTWPPFSDHARNLKVCGPIASALTFQKMMRGTPETRLPSVNASGLWRKLIVTPSQRSVSTSTSVTPRGISVGSTWTPCARYDEFS